MTEMNKKTKLKINALKKYLIVTLSCKCCFHSVHSKQLNVFSGNNWQTSYNNFLTLLTAEEDI